MNSGLQAAIAGIEERNQKIQELTAEIERLKEHIRREAKSKTLSVEMPSKENGGRFYVTAPWAESEERLGETMINCIQLLANVMLAIHEDAEAVRAAKVSLESPVAPEPNNAPPMSKDRMLDILAEAHVVINEGWPSKKQFHDMPRYVVELCGEVGRLGEQCKTDGPAYNAGRMEGHADLCAMLRKIIDPEDAGHLNQDGLLSLVSDLNCKARAIEGLERLGSYYSVGPHPDEDGSWTVVKVDDWGKYRTSHQGDTFVDSVNAALTAKGLPNV